MSDPSGFKIIKRAFDGDLNKIVISDEHFIFDIEVEAEVPDPLTLDELTVTTLKLLEPGGPSAITIVAPSLAGDLTFTLPDNDGDPGDVLTTDGDGNLTWEPASSSGAPADAEYIVVSLDPTLTDERRLQTESGVLSLADGGAGGDITLSIDANGISDAKLRQSAAVSVIGRSANSTGNVADIAAGANDRVLSRAGDALAFTQVSTGMVADDAITDAKLRESGACSVIGRSANSSGNPADISAAANRTVLVRLGDALSFSGSPAVQSLILDDDDASASITLQAPSALSGSYTITLPADDGSADEVLSTNGSGVTDWVPVDTVIAGRRDVYAWRHAGTTGFETWYTPSIHSEANVAATVESNVLMATPFVVTETMTIDRIAIHKNAAGSANSRGTVGIYNSTSRSNFYPNARLTATELDLDSDTGASAVVAATISLQLTPGLYWFAWNQDNSPAPPQLLCHDVSPSSISSILGVNPTTFATPRRSVRVAQTYDSAAMPDPFPGGAALDGTQQVPAIAVRVASYP